MTDQKAGELLGRLMAAEDKSPAAKRQFVQKLQKVLPANKVAQDCQVENRNNMLASEHGAGGVDPDRQVAEACRGLPDARTAP